MDHINSIAGIILAILANVVMLAYTAGRTTSKIESLNSLLRDYMGIADRRHERMDTSLNEVDRRVSRIEGRRRESDA